MLTGNTDLSGVFCVKHTQSRSVLFALGDNSEPKGFGSDSQPQVRGRVGWDETKKKKNHLSYTATREIAALMAFQLLKGRIRG